MIHFVFLNSAGFCEWDGYISQHVCYIGAGRVVCIQATLREVIATRIRHVLQCKDRTRPMLVSRQPTHLVPFPS